MTATVLVVEDEEAIGQMLLFNLQKAGFDVSVLESAELARPHINDKLPDVLILDWMLPQLSGMEFLGQLRADARTQNLPIIMLTARGEEHEKELGLNLGADDYVTKPFSPRELVARVKALLRRLAPQKTDNIIELDNLSLNPQDHSVFASGQAVHFAPTEFKLLHFFMTHPNRIYSRSELLDLVWGDHVFIEERTVDVHIRRLRKQLGSVGLDDCIETVRGLGYRFGKA